MATETARYDIVLGFKADVEAAKKQLYDLQQNIEKITNPCFKKLYRVYDESGMGMFDFLALHSGESDLFHRGYIQRDLADPEVSSLVSTGI